jgi:hypothetical protein
MYCDGARTLACKEYDDYNLAMIIEDFDDLDENMELGVAPRLPKGISAERRSFILEHRPMIEKWFERLHADALDDALRGLPTPGLKAVYGRNPPRKWKSEEEAQARLVAALGEDAYVKKLLSPAMAEKTLPPKLFGKLGSLIDKGRPKPTLASDQDAREAIAPIEDLFDELDEADEADSA